MTTNTDKNLKLLILVGDTWIDKNLCDKVLVCVKSNLSKMIPGVSLKLKQICGNDFWQLLSKGEKIHAGLYVSELVKKGELPLEFGEPRSHSNTFHI
jgi:hypothetical protein